MFLLLCSAAIPRTSLVHVQALSDYDQQQGEAIRVKFQHMLEVSSVPLRTHSSEKLRTCPSLPAVNVFLGLPPSTFSPFSG